MELSMELWQRMEEAAKDTAWTEKVRAAATCEEYIKLLAEKGIEAPAELKEAFSANRANKTGKLADDELEKVSGGWTPIFDCPQEYNDFLCRITFCPHMSQTSNIPENYIEYKCDLYHWRVTV